MIRLEKKLKLHLNLLTIVSEQRTSQSRAYNYAIKMARKAINGRNTEEVFNALVAAGCKREDLQVSRSDVRYCSDNIAAAIVRFL